MSKKVVEYFENLSKTSKIGHAFLICNCSLSFIEEELNEVISKCFFESETTEIYTNEDVIVIQPENNTIKKDQITFIHDKVKTTSQLHNKKIYIIDSCEKMNESAANSLLKLLEEPEENIYAFLISSNVDSVLKTIYSRCQILKLYNENLSIKFINSLDNEEIMDAIRVVKLIEQKKSKAIASYGFIIKKVKDRSYLRNLFNIMLLIYRDLLNIILNEKCEFFVNFDAEISELILDNTSDSVVKKLLIINKYIYKIDDNLNTNLLFDRYIIEVAGEENE